MKKTIGFSAIILITLMLICCISPLFADDTQTSTNSLYEFTLDSNKRATITAYKGKETSVSINKIDGRYTVVAIGAGAFAGNTSVAEIELSGNVKTIGKGAFAGCTKLESVRFVKDGLETIASDAFYGCTALKSLAFPSTLKAIGDGAFSGCSALVFDISGLSSLSSLGSHAFYNCGTGADSFSVVIPASLTDIGYGAFAGCSKVNAFEVSSANTAYISADGVLFSRDMEKLIFYPMGKRIESSEYTVPAGVKNIGEGAFTGAVLKKINLPEGVTSIGGILCLRYNRDEASFLA
jgi:hypothetical protein